MHNYLFSKSRDGNQKHWEELIEQYRQSNLSQTGFCSSHGLALSTFRYWLRKNRMTPAAANIELVEIEQEELFLSDPLLEIAGRDLTVRFFNGADADLVASVIRELGL